MREPTWTNECKKVDHASMTSNYSTLYIGNLATLMLSFSTPTARGIGLKFFLVDDMPLVEFVGPLSRALLSKPHDSFRGYRWWRRWLAFIENLS